jgi:hypothetical protein
MANYSSIIFKNKFAEENREDTLPYLTELLEGKSYSPSELERYSFSVMGWIQRIRDSCTALEHTRVYLRHFRSNKWYREAEIVQGNYINYHYTKYAITVITIMDVCLILTNDTFRLGNPERQCNLDKITRNSLVISSNVSKILNKLNRIVEPWRKPRNLFVHRGWNIYREKLTALEEYELLYLHEKTGPERKISSQKVKSLYQSELLKIFNEFDEVEPPLFNAVIELLSKLLPIYISWREKLKNPPIGNK